MSKELIYPETSAGRVTSGDPEIFDPREFPPPAGMEVQYFTVGGSLVRGRITKDNLNMCMGWMPFPKMPRWLKDRIREEYVKSN